MRPSVPILGSGFLLLDNSTSRPEAGLSTQMDLLHYIFMLAGLTYLITQSVIFRVFRMQLAKAGSFGEALIYCPACTGFWLGAALTPLWPFKALVFAPLESAVGACGLMALWQEWGPQVDVWQHEQGNSENDDSLEEKDGKRS